MATTSSGSPFCYCFASGLADLRLCSKREQRTACRARGLSCVLLGATALWAINASCRLEQLPITIKKAKSADKEVIGFFVAYVLPLLFRGGRSPDLGAWLMSAGMLLFVLWSTHALHVNPVLGLFGFHFYEVDTARGVTYLPGESSFFRQLPNTQSKCPIDR